MELSRRSCCSPHDFDCAVCWYCDISEDHSLTIGDIKVLVNEPDADDFWDIMLCEQLLEIF